MCWDMTEHLRHTDFMSWETWILGVTLCKPVWKFVQHNSHRNDISLQCSKNQSLLNCILHISKCSFSISQPEQFLSNMSLQLFPWTEHFRQQMSEKTAYFDSRFENLQIYLHTGLKRSQDPGWISVKFLKSSTAKIWLQYFFVESMQWMH